MASVTDFPSERCVAQERPEACNVCDLRERSICADLGPRELAIVDKTMARRSVQKDAAIMSEGEPNANLYVIVRGSFRLVKILEDGRRQITGFLFPGDFAGVRATEESAYTAEALEDSFVCAFPHRFLDEAAREAPGVKDRLIARSQTEYHRAQEHIVLLGKRTAEERVETFLTRLAETIGREGDDGVDTPLPMPRQDIADYLGLRLETLSRTLASLKKRAVIRDLTRQSVTVAR
ncbi:MAG: cyclic nucleotide-binding domain-containing protein [Pseudomonadota bacterium]